MVKDKIYAKGKISYELIGPDGTVKESGDFDNLVVATGLKWIVSRIAGETVDPINYMAVGTGSAAAGATDTTLGTEVSRKEVGSKTIVTSTFVGDSYQFKTTFEPGEGTGALTEIGLFTAASGGVMTSRSVFPVINKDADSALAFTWTYRIGGV